jgi:hypothetical protein
MKKLAVFVEGQTEQLFIVRLIKEVAGENNVIIDEEKRISGQCFTSINAHQINDNAKYYVLVRDCAADNAVKTAIIDAAESITRGNYQKIIGVLDVFPKTYTDIPKFKDGLNYRLPIINIPIIFILATMGKHTVKPVFKSLSERSILIASGVSS